MNLKEFIEWCENNSGIPDDEDEVFIQNRFSKRLRDQN
jgi:hypothetical protein